MAVTMKPRLLRSARYRGLSLHQWLIRMVFWTGAVVVAAGAILFAQGSVVAYELFKRVIGINPALALVVSPVGLVVALALTRKVFPGAQGSGIPQTIATVRYPEIAGASGLLSLRIALGKVLLTLLGLACGASVGREGPSVQVGAAIMFNLGRLLRMPRPQINRGLIIAGGAAGVAAAFNTPMAGVVFAIEELSRSFEERTSGRVFTAVIVAGIASLGVLGNYTYFGHTDASLDLLRGWEPVLACGVAGGLLGSIFARLLIAMSRGLPGSVGGWIRQNPVIFAGLCGLALALVGLASGNSTYGTGYEETKALLAGREPVTPSWGLLKMIATVISYASGIPGGIFAPSLAVGAGLGAEVARLMPALPAGAVILLGMVSYFTGAVQAPITAVVIVMEMTDNQVMTIHLMAAALIAFSVSRLVCHKPLYKTLAEGFERAIEPPRPESSQKALPSA